MSVQVKKKFEELVTYLGKDTKGLEKVKQLKDAVNELRKKLAAAEERLLQVEAVKNAARERADKAEVAIPELQLEVQRQMQQVSNLQQQLAESARVAEVIADVDVPPYSRHEIPQIRAAISLLVDNSPQHPRTVGSSVLHGRSVVAVDRADIAVGWSSRSLHILGAFVALTVAHAGDITIVGDRQRYQGELMARIGKNSSLAKRYIWWIKAAAQQADKAAAKAADMLTAVESMSPAELAQLSQQVYGSRANSEQSVEEETGECESQEVR